MALYDSRFAEHIVKDVLLSLHYVTTCCVTACSQGTILSIPVRFSISAAVRKDLFPCFYSVLSASSGDNDAAFTAGYVPKVIPTAVAMRNDMSIACGSMANSNGRKEAIIPVITAVIPIPTKMPMNPPISVKVTDSMRN